MTRERPSAPVVLARGMTKRCPICGQGKLFRGWFQIRERCPRCNLKLEQGEGAFLGSMSINYGIAGLAFFAFLAIWLALTLPEVEALPLTVGGIVVVTATLTAFFPFSKTIWCAIDVLLHHPSDLDFGDER